MHAPHLAWPALCPACNVVHRVGSDSLPRHLGELLRPYHNTYTPSRYPPSARKRVTGRLLQLLLAQGATGIIPLEAPGTLDADYFSVANNAVTVLREGHYLLWAGERTSSPGASQYTRVVRDGSPWSTDQPTDQSFALDTGLTSAGTTFGFQGINSGTVGNVNHAYGNFGEYGIVFVPTTAYPR